jgi:hypothetical protein
MGPRSHDWENAVWMRASWPPVTTSKREKERDEVGQPCRHCIVLLQVEKLVELVSLSASLPAGPSSLRPLAARLLGQEE